MNKVAWVREFHFSAATQWMHSIALHKATRWPCCHLANGIDALLPSVESSFIRMKPNTCVLGRLVDYISKMLPGSRRLTCYLFLTWFYKIPVMSEIFSWLEPFSGKHWTLSDVGWCVNLTESSRDTCREGGALGTLPVWVLLWRASSSDRANLFPQPGQLQGNGRSPKNTNKEILY